MHISCRSPRGLCGSARFIRAFLFLALCAFALPARTQQKAGHPASDLPAPQPASPELAPAEDSPTGSISGVVVDRDSTVYEGAHVALFETGPDTNLNPLPARTATTDSGGQFNFTAVPPGPFQLTVSSQGFATQVVSSVLHPGESYESRPIILPVATTSEVRVTASPEGVAEAQVRLEEQQRVLGIVPNFYVAYEQDAAPLTSRQKFDLAWRSSIDPVSFLASGASAGVEQATNSFNGYGQGMQGYAKRFGANYADLFLGTMIGSAIFPTLLKQDPRYFYRGTGTVRSRIFYAIATSVVCKGDNGHWQPNYSGFIGGLAASGISNLYYPASNRDGATLTFENAGIGIAEGAVENLLQEFVIRKLTPKLPKYDSAQH